MRILLTGGSACGKSTFAEQLIARMPRPYYYIATMNPYGADGQAKIAKHRAMRAGSGFATIEQYRDMHLVKFSERATVLFEDVINLLANEMFTEGGVALNAADKVIAGVRSVMEQANDIIIVTNEVGSDRQAYSPETLAYIEAVGAINIALAREVDCVYELVCGIPQLVRGEAAPTIGTA